MEIEGGLVGITADHYESLLEENRVLRFVLCMSLAGAEITVPWQSVYEDPVVDVDDVFYGYNGNTSNFELRIPQLYEVTDEES